jgi:hypothetical protein
MLSDRKKEEFEQYRRDAKKGDAAAIFGLGLCYSHGEGVKQDDELAVIFYEKAAAKGYARAKAALGKRYMIGKTVPKDLNKAKVLLQAAMADPSFKNANDTLAEDCRTRLKELEKNESKEESKSITFDMRNSIGLFKNDANVKNRVEEQFLQINRLRQTLPIKMAVKIIDKNVQTTRKSQQSQSALYKKRGNLLSKKEELIQKQKANSKRELLKKREELLKRQKELLKRKEQLKTNKRFSNVLREEYDLNNELSEISAGLQNINLDLDTTGNIPLSDEVQYNSYPSLNSYSNFFDQTYANSSSDQTYQPVEQNYEPPAPAPSQPVEQNYESPAPAPAPSGDCGGGDCGGGDCGGGCGGG